MKEVKGCLQKIKIKQFFPGTSPHKGQVVVLQLNCGHQVRRCAGKYIGKRTHCLICIENRKIKNAIN